MGPNPGIELLRPEVGKGRIPLARRLQLKVGVKENTTLDLDHSLGRLSGIAAIRRRPATFGLTIVRGSEGNQFRPEPAAAFAAC